MADPNYVEIRNLPRVNTVENNSLLLADNPSGLVTNSVTMEDFQTQTLKNVKDEFFPTTDTFTPSPSTTVEQYCNFLFSCINSYTDAPDSIRMININQKYHDYFVDNLMSNTDWMPANGSTLPNDSWHKIMNDGINNAPELRGRVPMGTDLGGNIDPDNAGQYPSALQTHAMVKITGTFSALTSGGGVAGGACTVVNTNSFTTPFPPASTINDTLYLVDSSRSSPYTATVTRPNNIKMFFIYRYKFTNF